VVLQLSGVLLDTAGWATTGLPESRLAALPCASPSAEDVLPAMALHAQEPGAAAPFLPEPPSSQPWRKTPRYRLGMIRLHLRALYREALHDLLPPILTRLASRAARALTRAAHGMLSRRQARVEAATQPLHEDWQAGMLTVTLDGLVFAAVHGAWDPSWHDLLTAFVTTCRAVPRATLVVKTGGLDALARASLPATLRRLGPFACRVVILDGNLAGGLDPLIAATSFYVCASHAEAAPLPMMRFLAAGRPAISPTHSALADLLDGTSGLPVAAGPDYDVFPGDSRERLHARAWRLDWESLCAALDAARTLSPPAYAERSLRAAAHLAAFCDHDRLRAALAELLATPAPVRRAA
jgi:glycosyltransferase involved in cell wall biosynthesis